MACPARARIARRAVLSLACAGLSLLASPIGTSVAWSQTAQPAAVAGGGTAVANAIAGLQSGDRDRVVAARQALISPLSGAARNQEFLGNYATEVARAILPVVNGTDAHAKLNAAIALQRIADASGSTALSPVLARLVSDDSPAIASFGLRAANNVLPRVLADRVLANSDQLLPAVLAATQKHPTSEAVVNDAYGALTRVIGQQARIAIEQLGPGGVTAATPRIVEAVQGLMATRLQRFGTGTVVEPGAEAPAVAFLARSDTWNLMNPAQKTQTVRLLLGFLRGGLNEMGALKAPQAADRPRSDALRGLVRSTAQGLGVVAALDGKAALKTVSDEAQSLGAAATPADFTRVVDAIQTAFVAAYPDAAAATRPTAAPGTAAR